MTWGTSGEKYFISFPSPRLRPKLFRLDFSEICLNVPDSRIVVFICRAITFVAVNAGDYFNTFLKQAPSQTSGSAKEVIGEWRLVK